MSTGIQWTDETWNPVTGCTKVSQGCKHCYAEGVADRFWGDRDFTDVRTHPERLEQPLRWRKPRRVFVNSMSDLFHEDVPDGFIEDVFRVMREAPRHTFQILTKRPDRMRALVGSETFRELLTYDMDDEGEFTRPWPQPNVWLGVSVEDQATADQRVPVLLDTPAVVRFLSCEPLLGPVDLRRPVGHRSWLGVRDELGRRRVERFHEEHSISFGEEQDRAHVEGVVAGVDWLIVGGESGPQARPMDLAWARSLVEQGREAGVPVFVKQLGRRPWEWTDRGDHGVYLDVALRDSHGGDIEEWPEDLRVREFPESPAAVRA